MIDIEMSRCDNVRAHAQRKPRKDPVKPDVYKNARGETVMPQRFFRALDTERITRHIMRTPYPNPLRKGKRARSK